MSLHCWFDFDDGEWLDDDTRTAGHTCMLAAGHDGPHEPTPDKQLVIGIAEAYVDGRLTPTPHCPTCDGSGYGGDSGHAYNTQEEYDGVAEHVCRECPVACPDCNGSGYDPGTIERIVSVIRDEGWTCEGHEPDPECPVCKPIHHRTAVAVLDALYGKDT